MNKKAATPIAIALLVIAALVLSIATLTILAKKENAVSATFYVPYSIEDVYVLEEQIRFYIAEGKDLEKIKSLFESETLVIEINGREITATEYVENMIISYKFEV